MTIDVENKYKMWREETQDADPLSYPDFFKFVVATIAYVIVIVSASLGVFSVFAADSATGFVGVFVLSLVFGLLYAFPVLISTATVGWLVWRGLVCLVPLWLVVLLVAATGGFALSFALSAVGPASQVIGKGVSFDVILSMLWTAARISAVAVPISLFVAWRTYGRLI